MKCHFLLFSTVLFLFSCGNGESASGSDYNPEKKIVEVKMNGEDLQFTRLRNGTIPGGEVTQMYAQSDDYDSYLKIRWGRKPDGSYDFENPPSIKLNLNRKDDVTEEYRAKDGEDVSKYFEGDKVYRVSGKIKMRSSNENARKINPEGVTLEIELQKKKRK